MPAQSKAQQRFMGMVHAAQKGELDNPSPEVEKAADSMSDKDAKDFASTKHKGLPNRVKQEIVKKLKEYSFIGDKHVKHPEDMKPLRSDDEMDLQEDRIPQNFNVGTTSDYHTKLATTPRKKYDDTNFDDENSGQPDLDEAQAVSGGKVHKFITGKNLKFKNKSYPQIHFETLSVDNKNGTIRLKIIAPKEIFGNEMSLEFRTVRRGPFFKTDTTMKEWGSTLDNSYILNKDAKLDGTPEEVDAIDRDMKPIKEATATEIAKDLDKVRHDLIKKVDVLIAKKKKLYSNMDIESPMSAEEKQLDKDIQSIFSQIQQIIQQKRKMKNESVNEGLKHLIHVETPKEILSKSVASQIMALAKKGVRSSEIGLNMGFIGNNNAAVDSFQKVKNKIYFSLDKRNESVNESSFVKGKTYGGTKCEGGCFIGKQGLMKIIKISKDNPNNTFIFRQDNFSGLQPHFIKNGVIGKATTLNPSYDLDRNKVRNLKITNDIILSIQLFESVNENVNEIGVGDWHFKAIKALYQKAGSFGRKKIAALITKNPNASWSQIENELKDSDYSDVSHYTDALHLESITEVETPRGDVQVLKVLNDIVKTHSAEKVKDQKTGKVIMVDVQSANVVLKVYDALSTANKAKFINSGLNAMIKISWEIMGKK
jgi:hypothetical protein